MEQDQNVVTENLTPEIDEKKARKERLWARRMERRHKRNQRIARFRTLKNLFIWLLGVLFLPLAIVATSFVVPISVFTGNDGTYVSQDISRRSILETVKFVANNSSELGFSDFPIVAKSLGDLTEKEIGDGKKVGDLISIDTDKINTIKFSSENLSGDIQSCVEIVATLSSLTSKESLGAFGSIIFNEEEEAGVIAGIDVAAEGFNAKEYYYKPSELGTTAMSSASDAQFKRAFNDDGTLVDELKNLTEADKSVVKLYYPPMQDVKLGELLHIFGDCFGRTKVASLMGAFDISEDSIIVKILGKESKVSDLKSFDLDSKELNLFIDEKEEPDETLYETPEDYNAAVSAYKDNKQMWDLLKAAVGKDGAESTPVTIGDITNGLKINNVKLNVLIEDSEENADLYKILRDATGVDGETEADKNAKITVGDLSKINTENLHLCVVLTPPDDTAEPGSAAYNKNRKLYDILLDLSKSETVTKYEDIMVKNLSGLNTDNLHLSVVLTPPDDSAEPTSDAYKQNRKLYDILLDLSKSETITKYEDIKVENLSGLDTNKLHLSVVLEDNAANAKLYNILKDLTGKTDSSAITVENLSGLDTNKLHLSVVLEDNAANAKLYNILKDLTGKTDSSTITVENLSGLDTNNLHLNVVLNDVDLSANQVLTALKEKNIKVGEIGTALNALSLYEVYGVDAFKADDGEIASLDKARRLYRVFSEEGSAVYMLETTAVVTSAPSELYYHCYEGDSLPVANMAYKTLAELGTVYTTTEYYKCTDKTSPTTSFELVSPVPDTETYSYDVSVTYYKTANNYYVTTDYKDCGLYKIYEEANPSVDKNYYIDNRDLLTKSDNYEYFACYDNGVFKGYFTVSDAAGYTYDDGIKYMKATDHGGNTVYYLDEYQYLDKDAGIWLLLSFDTAEYDSNNIATRRYADQNGKAYKYAVDAMTIGNLQKGSSFAKKFKNSTIKQLVDSGLVDDPQFNDKFYKFSLQELLDHVKTTSTLP